jgi:hypothetical protein
MSHLGLEKKCIILSQGLLWKRASGGRERSRGVGWHGERLIVGKLNLLRDFVL